MISRNQSLFACFLLFAAPTAADIPRVVTDISPVRSLVARVMEGLGEPTVLIRPGASPHDYAMRPSEAAALAGSDIVFWIGPALSPWMESPLNTLAKNAKVLALVDTPGLTLLERRENAIFEDHDHEGHDHGDHGADAPDPHIWLDPQNGAAMLTAIAEELSKADPDNAETYRENANRGRRELADLSNEITALLSPIKSLNYIVLHDAYHYFEARFEVEATGALSASDDAAPGAARVADVEQMLSSGEVTCVLTAAGSGDRTIRSLTEGTSARIGALDPLGAGISDQGWLYAAILRTMAQTLKDCLSD